MTLIMLEELDHLELKAVRKVRTPGGAKKYGQEIGTIIVADGKPPLKNLKIAPKGEYVGWDLVHGSDGKQYDVGMDETTGHWVATRAGSWDDIAVDNASSEEEVYTLLDKAVGTGKRRKGDTLLGSHSKYDTERDRTKGRKHMQTQRDQAKDKYGDRRKAGYDKFVSAAIINYDKAVKDGDYAQAQDWLDKMFESIKARHRQDQLRADAALQDSANRNNSKKGPMSVTQVQERAAQMLADLQESSVFQKHKAQMEAHDKKKRDGLARRVDALKKYTDEGPGYDRDIAGNISRYHEEMANLAGADGPTARNEVISNAQVHLQRAERRADAKRNTGIVQHSPVGQPEKDKTSNKKPTPGQEGSSVTIGGMKVTVTRSARRDAHGMTDIGMHYLDRDYDVQMPSYQAGKASKITVTDPTSGKQEEGFLPPREEAGATPADRAQHANSLLAGIIKRLHGKLGDSPNTARRGMLQKGSAVLSTPNDDKNSLSGADRQKFQTLKRHLDLAIATNDGERAAAVLDLLDETLSDSGVDKKHDTRKQIERLQDATKYMTQHPTLSLDRPMTNNDLAGQESWVLQKFLAASESELADVAGSKRKADVARAETLKANISRTQHTLASSTANQQ